MSPRMLRSTLCTALALASGCGGDDTAPSCVAACEKAAAPACPKAPSYGASCEDQCKIAYEQTAEPCRDAAEAVYACYADRATFECRADGTLHTVPSDVCASESAKCSECTGGDYVVCIGG